MPAIHVCHRKSDVLQDGATCKRCGTIVLGGAPGPAHRCDRKPGSSHDVSTCSRCEVPA